MSDNPNSCEAPSEEDVSSHLDRLRTLVDKAITKSSEEVLSVGTSIEEIVKQCRASLEATDHEARWQSDTTEQFMGRINASLQAHAEALGCAIDRGAAAVTSGKLVGNLASQARFLSINAQILAARYSSSTAGGFVAVAVEMRELSTAINVANDEIKQSLTDLEQSLNELTAHVATVRQNSDEFASQIQARIGDTESGPENNDVEIIVQRAYDALGHLQFQDPMAQDLRYVRNMLRELVESDDFAKALKSYTPAPGEAADDSSIASDVPEEERVNTGEVLLF